MILTRRLLALAPALLLALPVARGQDDLYRISGRGDANGRFTGLVRVDPSDRVAAEVHYANAVDEVFGGAGRRLAAGLAVDLNPVALTGALSGATPAQRVLLLRFGVGTAAIAGEVTGAPALLLRGQRLLLSREVDLQPAARLAAFHAAGREGTFVGVDGLSLRYVCFDVPAERGVVVIVPGRTEFAERYAEVAADLLRLGYSVDILDNRGHGRSEHILGRADAPGTPERDKCHVQRFQDYVDDLHTFVSQVVRQTPRRRLFLLGHSMGGAICTRFAEEFPSELDGAVLSSPMHGIPVSFWERRYVDLQVLIGRGRRYARGEGPYDPSGAFAGNDCTHSRARFDYEAAAVAADPALRVGGPTYRWVRESFRASKPMLADAGRITAPVLLLQAGDERVVVNANEDQVAAKIRRVTKVVLPGALHELLQESDGVRREALARIVVFFDRWSQ